jgi:subtilisin family serine protease
VSGYAHLPPYRVDLVNVPHTLAEGVDWGLTLYGIPSLWGKTRGEGVTVAVVDTGVSKHPALTDVVCDYRNFSSDSDMYDTVGHGTHVAGIIGARTGMAKGIAPGVCILSLKALGHSGMGSNASVAQAVRFAIEAKADVICMSLGSTAPDDSVHSAVRDAHKNGVVVVCAAGNDGGAVNYPAAFQETIAVGAVDRNGTACEFSSRGKEIAVAAPGEAITSCWLNDSYATVSGTSMAAPFVAGVIALYVSSAKRDNRKITHSDVLKALADTCRDVGEAGRDNVYGWGLLDPHKLLNYSVTANISGVTIFIPGGKVL